MYSVQILPCLMWIAVQTGSPFGSLGSLCSLASVHVESKLCKNGRLLCFYTGCKHVILPRATHFISPLPQGWCVHGPEHQPPNAALMLYSLYPCVCVYYHGLGNCSETLPCFVISNKCFFLFISLACSIVFPVGPAQIWSNPCNKLLYKNSSALL